MQAQNRISLLTLLATTLFAGISPADTSFLTLPERGATQTQVQEKFGSPETQQPAVGEPPITRWNYPAFTVVFEREHVIHAFNRSNAVENLPDRNQSDALEIPVTTQTEPPEQIEQTTPAQTTEHSGWTKQPVAAKSEAVVDIQTTEPEPESPALHSNAAADKPATPETPAPVLATDENLPAPITSQPASQPEPPQEDTQTTPPTPAPVSDEYEVDTTYESDIPVN